MPRVATVSEAAPPLPSCKLVQDGNVEIELFLTEDSAAVIGLIKPLGFAVSQNRPERKDSHRATSRREARRTGTDGDSAICCPGEAVSRSQYGHFGRFPILS
jgi:hypothetical protein